MLVTPYGGLDPSWLAGLYMAAERGLGFGTRIVFTYGPLGFLSQPWIWYPGLAALAWWFGALLQVALAVSLVWALRRSLGPLLAAVLSAVILIVTPWMNLPIALAAIWCLAALSPEPPRFAWSLVLYGGAVFGAVETLIQVRNGPVILAMCALTLAAGERKRVRLPVFTAIALASMAILWFAAGQTLAAMPDFVGNSVQIVVGYGEAMGLPGYAGFVVPGLILVAAALVPLAAMTSRMGAPRLAACAVVGLAAFALYKEAVVRADEPHAASLFETAAIIGSVTWYGRRWLVQLAAIGAGLAIVLITLPSGSAVNFNPITHAREAGDQVQTALDPNHLRASRDFARSAAVHGYQLSPTAIALLRGRTVHVDPWEAAVAWAYRLNWDPLPVFQSYSAYTSALDGLNARAEASARGPARILRENTKIVDSRHTAPTIDGRVPAWDPPRAALIMLCNYQQAHADPRWQVLAKTSNRCGAPRRVESMTVGYRRPVEVPSSPAGGVVYAVVAGFGVSGFDRVKTLLYRADARYVLINGARVFRVVPGTAGDGLLLNADPHVDYPAPYALSPGARTIAFSGGTDALRVTFYRMTIRRATGGGAVRAGAGRTGRAAMTRIRSAARARR